MPRKSAPKAEQPYHGGMIRDTALDDLKPHPDNPRKGDVERIAASIRRHGFHGTLVAQTSTGHIIAGEHRWRALQLLGGAPVKWDDAHQPIEFAQEVAVDWREVDDAEAVEIMLADNRASDLADYDQGDLARLLAEVPDPSAALWDQPDVDALLHSIAPPAEQHTSRPVRSLREMRTDYADAAVRQLIFGFARLDYNWVVGRLTELRESRGIDTNQGILIALLEDATGKKISEGR